MTFLDEQYLLESEPAQRLYADIEDLPIVDPHNHVDLEEVVENDSWADIWEVEGATDHYVWQLMRKRGVPEEKITGGASNREKWDALASVFPDFAGNPTYEWVHLDLERRFGIDERISAETADDIWARTREQLAGPSMRPQNVLADMGVEVLCSTDDPTDSLECHERAEDEVEGVDVRPTWRPDRAFAIGDGDWTAFVDDLDAATDESVDSLSGFLSALAASHEYFREHGCRACDIGIRDPVSKPVGRDRARRIYGKARRGRNLQPDEAADFRAFLLEEIGELNREAGWVTQFHVGAIRNYRESLYETLGPDAGGDVSTQNVDIVAGLDHFLDAFDADLEVVVYTLDPTHYPSAATLARAYPNVSVGPAWWFNDSPHGLEEQLRYVGSTDLLTNYAGMVSDSRKLVSYGSRFEMFRRVLANVLGDLVERGQVPFDNARRIARHVAYDRPKELYGF